eukprot:6968365-Prymnesium_polylepis.1
MSMFHENCRYPVAAPEYGIPFDGPPPVVSRERVALADGRGLSMLKWGASPAEVVFLHGGAQNAHTWDTVALALSRLPIGGGDSKDGAAPTIDRLLCIDLPSHGHSDAALSPVNDPAAAAAAVAQALDVHAPSPVVVVGM